MTVRILLSTWLFALIAGGAVAQTAATDTIYDDDLSELSFEELMDIPVTSAARKAVRISDTMAAVYVITAEEIHDHGLTSVPEALRLVPGVEVARIDANKYAIGVRGLNSRFSDMLLVMVDGRTVYNPLFSGVLWEALDVDMEDVDRIEVIRGPGATLWGANAVNGVINVITKDAGETAGGLATAHAGTRDVRTGTLRWGGRLGAGADFRISGSYRRHGNFEAPDGSDVNDEYEIGHGGGRLDWRRGRDHFTLLAQYGEATVAENDYALTSPTPPYGGYLLEDASAVMGHVLGRWQREDQAGGHLTLQAFLDHVDYDYPTFSARHNTTDFELQYQPPRWGRHDIVAGLGARVIDTETNGSFSFSFRPGRRQDLLVQAFFQDEITLIEGRLDAVLGAKIEHNEFTGLEPQPNIRLRWRPDERHTVWASRSRAVRTPSIGQRTIDLLLQILPSGHPDNPSPLPLELRFQGYRDDESVRMYAHELGVRSQVSDALSTDLALFHNDYSRIDEPVFGDPYVTGPASAPNLVQPVLQRNTADKMIWGGELAMEWQPTDFWQVRGWIALLDQDEPADGQGTALVDRMVDPERQAGLRSAFRLRRDAHASLSLRSVSALDAIGIDAYTELDACLAWHPTHTLSVAVGGHNLLHENHREFVQDNIIVSQAAVVPRMFSLRMKWGF